MNYRYQKVMMNIFQFKLDDWYQFGRFRSEQDIGDAYTFSEDRIIRRTLICGMIRENRYQLLYIHLPSYFYRNIFDTEMVTYATNRKMVEYLEEFQKYPFNLYRYQYMVGKCRVLPLKKIKKWIDGLTKKGIVPSPYGDNNLYPDDEFCLIECLKSSVENTDKDVFNYLYKVYRKFKLEREYKVWHLIDEAFSSGNISLLELLLPLSSTKELARISEEYKPKIREYIKKINQRNILLFEKIQGSIYSKIPKDVMKHIINKFIFPEL
jgi:hypothetical protein